MISENYVNLSHPLEESMTVFPPEHHAPFRMKQLGFIDKHGRETREIRFGTHCGTHVDAAKHFFTNGVDVSEIALGTLIGPAFLINLAPTPPGFIIERGLIDGKLPDVVERLIIRTDWSKHWKTSNFYQNWPNLSMDCAKFIANHGIKLIGFDFPSPDPYQITDDPDDDSPIHKLFLSKNMTLVEYLTNLDRLPEGWIDFIALPLNVKGADGCPVRAVAKPMGPLE